MLSGEICLRFCSVLCAVACLFGFSGFAMWLWLQNDVSVLCGTMRRGVSVCHLIIHGFDVRGVFGNLKFGIFKDFLWDNKAGESVVYSIIGTMFLNILALHFAAIKLACKMACIFGFVLGVVWVWGCVGRVVREEVVGHLGVLV